MDTLDNANNPFAIPNKTDADSITSHNDDGLLLNITDGLKKNDDMANNDLIKMLEKSNCERLTPEFDEDDNLGPETDVDNLDDGSISVNSDVMQRQLETIDNNQNFNPFKDIEKSLEINLNLKEGTFEGLTTPTEESCPLPTNSGKSNKLHFFVPILYTGCINFRRFNNYINI
ncbi:hypothetical protein HHI36_009051 [Cryptolaemus montrouzieri]|uniref:Uncharacterized protein n=1 Tax=Cryptolaemus montrouzieri TaxID=559131 RepID=A0ABD2MUC1_9CUCU